MADEHPPDGRNFDAAPRLRRNGGAPGADLALSIPTLNHEPAPAPRDGFDPYWILRVIYLRRWTALSIFVMVMTGGAIYTLTTIPIYEARTRVLIEPERLNILKIEDIIEKDRSIDSQVAVLQSRWLAKKTMESLQLLRVDEAAAVPAVPPSGLRARARDVLASVPGVRRLVARAEPPPLDAQGREAAQIDGFLAGLAVTPASKGILDIKYVSPDPALAARIANRLTEQYMAENLELRFAAVKEVTDWLAARLAEQREKVDVSEKALQRFREQNQIVVSDGSENPAVAKLNELSNALLRAKTVKLEKESVLNKARALRADPASLVRLPQMLADPVVQQVRTELEKLEHDRAQMSEKLQDQHPDMVKMRGSIQAAQSRLQVEMDRVLQTLRDDAVAAQANENTFAAAMDTERQAALGLNRKSLELGILDREAQSNRQIYDMLVQRARETNIAKEIRPSQIRVLDPADVPRAPFLPKTKRQLMLSAFVGLALALGIVLGLDQIDNRIKTPDEIRTRLNLPFLGMLPEVKFSDPSQHGPNITNGVPPSFVEAMRSIRTNVLYSFADEALKVLVVTSATSSEGKTVVASNLAIALAQAGERVLLVDADMRRPTVHQVFGVKRDPGLSDFLVGNIKASEGVQRTRIPNLWLLPSGRRPPNPPELLGSERFRKALAGLNDYFEWVVLDAPPVMPVTDACVLGRASSGVLFVVGAEHVSRHVARRALEQLLSVDSHLIGGVLARVNLDRNSYYYGEYYRREYAAYATVSHDT